MAKFPNILNFGHNTNRSKNLFFSIQMLTQTIPVNSEGLPKLAVFYMAILVESALSLGATCIVLTFHHASLGDNIRPLPW